MAKSIYDQLPDWQQWIATTDRNFKTYDRVVHVEGGHNGRSPCPIRGELLSENPYRKGYFGLLFDGAPEADYSYPDLKLLVKESEFDEKGLEAQP